MINRTLSKYLAAYVYQESGTDSEYAEDDVKENSDDDRQRDDPEVPTTWECPMEGCTKAVTVRFDLHIAIV